MMRPAPWLLFLLAALPALAAPAPQPERPNIVFVLLDDAGFSDLGAYGSEIATPHLDRIAQEGVRFANFHTASTCEASRVMLHSGVDHHRAGAGTLQVVIAENQKGRPGYEGYLSDRVPSLGQLMRDGGYATYYAGKWNIGNGLARSPGARGWERYVALEQTGADNYEAKVYAPFNDEALWWQDGQRLHPPPGFYSSRYYVDRLLHYIDEGRPAGKPFFAMLAFQAVHSPLQAPAEDIARYRGRYDAGWTQVRQARYQRQVEMGLVPPGLTLPRNHLARDWASLSGEEQRFEARKMEVFAAMLTSADRELGRLRDHLARSGELERTVFIVMSDNGADAYDLSRLNLPFRAWYSAHYALAIDTLGAKGSYVHYGQDWAEVSNTPFNLFKGSAGEGGMRVPLVIAAPGRITQPGRVTQQFAYATDLLPTVLDLAGIALPSDDRGGTLHLPTGSSLMPYLEGRAERVHAQDAVFGFEGTGAQAIFRGDYKLMRNPDPLPDKEWRLYRLDNDPTESHDLSTAEPEVFRALLAEARAYEQRVGVVLPEAGYQPLRQLLRNNWPVLLRQLGPLFALALAALAALAALIFFAWRRAHRRVRA